MRRVGSSKSGFLTMPDQPYPDELKNTLPDIYLTAIGRVSVNWGMLESIMDLAISKFAAFEHDDPRGAIVTAHMSWPQKMDVLEAFASLMREDYPHLAKFDALKPLLKKAQEGRNRVSHGQWGTQADGTIHKLRLTARGKLAKGSALDIPCARA
jgi:hypothetical protein